MIVVSAEQQHARRRLLAGQAAHQVHALERQRTSRGQTQPPALGSRERHAVEQFGAGAVRIGEHPRGRRAGQGVEARVARARAREVVAEEAGAVGGIGHQHDALRAGRLRLQLERTGRELLAAAGGPQPDQQGGRAAGGRRLSLGPGHDAGRRAGAEGRGDAELQRHLRAGRRAQRAAQAVQLHADHGEGLGQAVGAGERLQPEGRQPGEQVLSRPGVAGRPGAAPGAVLGGEGEDVLVQSQGVSAGGPPGAGGGEGGRRAREEREGEGDEKLTSRHCVALRVGVP